MHEDPNSSIVSSLTALRRNFFLILSISVLVFVLSWGIVKNIPGTYEVHFSYMISMEQKDVPEGFRYDGFYGLSAADLFSTTLAGIATSPETIVAAYEAAALMLPTQDAFALNRIVTSEKTAPQLVRLTVRDASKKNAERLASGLVSVVDERLAEYNAKGLSSISFHAVPTKPWTSHSVIQPLPVAASLFMLVFVGAHMIVLFREAIRRGSS